MDACIADIFTALEALGIEDETLVVINSDHGETLYDHDCYFDHHGLYDCTLHVPLIFRYPGKVPAGQRVRGLHASMKDIMPTLLDLLGIKTEHRVRRPQPAAADAAAKPRAPEPEFYITECTWMRKHGWRTPRVEADPRAGAGLPLQARGRAVQPDHRPRRERQPGRAGAGRGGAARGAHAGAGSPSARRRPAAQPDLHQAQLARHEGVGAVQDLAAGLRHPAHRRSGRPRRRSCRSAARPASQTHDDASRGTAHMLRVCVIGMGPIGNRHADIYKEDPLAELVGVCDILQERADAAAERLGVPAFYDAPTMLAALKPDLCSVATGGYEYGSDHYEPTMQALEAGCHVLCEKPICNEIAKAEEMVAKAREKKRCFGIDLNHRFTPARRLAKKWLDEGRLGHLLFVNMSMWIMNPHESSPYFQIKALHPHTVDMMRYFCGDIEAVQCFATKAPGRKIWSTAHFNMRFKNGVVGGADRQLRHRARPPDGALRGGRHRRALRARRHVARGDALPRRQPGEDGLHQPGLRRHARLRGHLPQPHPPLPASRSTDGVDAGGDRRLRRRRPGGAEGAAAAIESLETEKVVHVK